MKGVIVEPVALDTPPIRSRRLARALPAHNDLCTLPLVRWEAEIEHAASAVRWLSELERGWNGRLGSE